MSNPSAEVVREHCQAKGFDLGPEQAEKLALYLQILLQWNRRMNLVGAKNWRDALDNLILDSFHLAAFLQGLELQVSQTWDLGAGAGLPGIPLRLLWQQGEYWLVEAREKRALFLSNVLARLDLPNCFVHRGRAEDFMAGRQADLILSRAFMPWPEMLELVQPHLAENATLVFLSNEKLEADGAWRTERTHSYQSGGKTRWFNALKRN